MKQFFEHIHVDAQTLRFYADCPICGKRQYGARIPSACRCARTLFLCTRGEASPFAQSRFNHARTNATLRLALRFNQCRHCLRWVCDDCYDVTDALGACVDCSQTE